jgi:hypothetical protein
MLMFIIQAFVAISAAGLAVSVLVFLHTGFSRILTRRYRDKSYRELLSINGLTATLVIEARVWPYAKKAVIISAILLLLSLMALAAAWLAIG